MGYALAIGDNIKIRTVATVVRILTLITLTSLFGGFAALSRTTGARADYLPCPPWRTAVVRI